MIASNATPLIYLARTGNLELLKIFGKVCIPEEVRKEVVEEGKKLGKKDAFIVEDAIKKGWILVKKARPIKLPIKLDAGEAAAISLAKILGTPVLIDETMGRTAARLAGIEPRGTIFVLLKALKKRKINMEEFLQTLDRLILEGFRLREEVYMLAIKKAMEISGK